MGLRLHLHLDLAGLRLCAFVIEVFSRRTLRLAPEQLQAHQLRAQ